MNIQIGYRSILSHLRNRTKHQYNQLRVATQQPDYSHSSFQESPFGPEPNFQRDAYGVPLEEYSAIGDFQSFSTPRIRTRETFNDPVEMEGYEDDIDNYGMEPYEDIEEDLEYMVVEEAEEYNALGPMDQMVDLFERLEPTDQEFREFLGGSPYEIFGAMREYHPDDPFQAGHYYEPYPDDIDDPLY